VRQVNNTNKEQGISGDLQDALALLNEDQPQLVAEIQLRAAETALRTGDLDKAEALLTHVSESPAADQLKQNISDQLLSLAKALTRHGPASDPEHIEHILRSAHALAPASAATPLAQFLQRQGRQAEAIQAWQEAIRLNPQEANNYLALARLYRQQGQAELARNICLDLIAAAPSAKNTLHVAAFLDELSPELPAPQLGQTVRVALLGNATLDHLQSYFKVELYKAGLFPELYQGGFGQYTQDILDPASPLYAFKPDVLVLAVHPSRLFPNLHTYPFNLTIEQRRAELEQGLETVASLLNTFSQRSQAMVLLHNMVVPQRPALGTLDLREELGQTAAFSEINVRLAEMARTRFKNVYIVDEDAVQSRYGKSRATDQRMWLAARLPWADGVLAGLAGEYMRYIRPLKGLSRKCVVLDLDNTLWGGVIGEDGLAGIQLGSEAPGSAFVAFQRELEKLWKRGILLAINSKNNPDDALPVFEKHHDMVLKLSHFATHRINWEQKADNIRSIAKELNIGLDSLVFLDDNPVERARVRAELPQVLVPELPTDPALYRAALLELGVFDALALTEEDKNRNKLYAEQRARQDYEANLGSTNLEEYLAGLEMVVEIAPANSLTLPRIAQLTNKTNQFNLTTRRYSEAQIDEMQARGSLVYSMNVTDRFGDNGLVGVAILTPKTPDTWEIDSFLMSCRVMGRGVETALLASLANAVSTQGATRLEGWFLPTAKNEPVKDFYPRHNFEVAEQHPDGRTLYSFDLEEGTIDTPPWLTVRVAALI
jgi:FkbH-like protein